MNKNNLFISFILVVLVNIILFYTVEIDNIIINNNNSSIPENILSEIEAKLKHQEINPINSFFSKLWGMETILPSTDNTISSARKKIDKKIKFELKGIFFYTGKKYILIYSQKDFLTLSEGEVLPNGDTVSQIQGSHFNTESGDQFFLFEK